MRWLILDLFLVLVFAAVGRASHAESLTAGGLAQTAWPFLVGAGVAWLAIVVRGWAPPSLGSGVLVWISTVVVGMLLRTVSDQGTATPFVIVATIVTAVLLLGWRLLARRALATPAAGAAV